MRSLLLIMSWCLALSSVAVAAENDVAIVGATIINVQNAGRSTRDHPNATILIRNGVFAEVGDRGKIAIPRGTRVVDASGRYVVPGLIDGFGGVRAQSFADAYLYEGVTSVYVTRSPSGEDGEQIIAETPSGPRLIRGATISGYLPDGAVPATHPWTEHRLRDARKSAGELISEIDHLADSGVRGLQISFDVWPDQLDIIVGEARRRQLATTIEPAFTSYPYAVRAGIGALIRNDRYETALATPQDLLAYADDPMGKGVASAFRDVCGTDLGSPILAALGAQLAESHTALMPILSIEATADDVGAPNPWRSRSSAFVRPNDLDDPVDPKTGARPYLESHPDRWQALQACARHRQDIDGNLHRAGALYLAGSGTPAFGIMPGGGLHQELRLLQHIGLTPREALAAATSNFVDVFGWQDIGLIEAGRAGDLLVVGSDPRLDVSALDDIRTVVHDGRVIDRKALLAAAIRRYGSEPKVSLQPTDAPKLFAPESDWPAGSDASPAFTPDGKTVFFTHAVDAARTIMVSHLRDNVWTAPEVASFSGTWRDIEPVMAPDGSYLLFVSNRPVAADGEPLNGLFGGVPRPGAGGNIWRVNREAHGWGQPVRLSTVVNSSSSVYAPAIARDGSVYFMQPDPTTSKFRLFRTQSAGDGFLAPASLPFSDGEVADFDPAVAPDESFIVFSSGRLPAPAKQAILFIAFAQNGHWTAPRALEPLVPGLEARLSPDVKMLYFSADGPPSNAARATGAAMPSRIFQLPVKFQ
jgi:hypothetical protein